MPEGEIAARDRQIAELTATTDELQSNLRVFGDLQTRIERLDRQGT